MSKKIPLIGYLALHSTVFAKPEGSLAKIDKETFEEKSFYPDKLNVYRKDKKSKKEKADKPLSESVVVDKNLNVSTDVSYIEVSGKKIHQLKFEDGSIYQIGKGFASPTEEAKEEGE